MNVLYCVLTISILNLSFPFMYTPPEAHWFVFFQSLLQGEHIKLPYCILRFGAIGRKFI